jgi:YesN/AraC family two-component response regulator
MQFLKTGDFFGQTCKKIQVNNLTITESEYKADKIDWHYHEDAYFTFILSGELLDGNRKQKHHCSPGTLLFHNWQEPHYNIMLKKHTKSLHIELKNKVTDYSVMGINAEGCMNINDPQIKILFHQIYKETKIYDSFSAIEIERLFLNVTDNMQPKTCGNRSKVPLWVYKVRDILNGQFSEKITLDYLAAELDIHPVHLSRDFSKYFSCTLGDYIRKTKVERALSLLSNKSMSLTEIAFNCGFADQSHFQRCFKQTIGIAPFKYRKIISY